MTTNVLDKTNSVLDESLDSPAYSISSQEADANEFALTRRFSRDNRKAFAQAHLHPNIGYTNGKEIKRALTIVLGFKAISNSTSSWWDKPLVNVNDEEIVLEWWNQERKITIYVHEDTTEYVKVWGPDIDNEMEDGNIRNSDDMFQLWSWISSRDA
jgi:hypothetical protein